MALNNIISNDLKVLICDDNPDQYNTIKECFREENISCSKRITNEDELRNELKNSNDKRKWYDFVMIDIDLSGSGEINNGIQVFNSIEGDFPDETYVIYSSQDIDSVRKQINRLRYRDVQIVLLDEITEKSNIRYHLTHLIQASPRDKVFVVHGRNGKKNSKIIKLLKEQFRLQIVDWETARENANNPRNYIYDIVMQGIAMSHLTLVVFTDDEEVILRKPFIKKDDHENTIKTINRRQSRANVYIEAGYAMGKRPKRTIFLEWPDREKFFGTPSDFAGMHTIRYDDTDKSREVLKKRLESARCIIKPKRGWQKAKL